MIYPDNPGIKLRALINILDRDTSDLAEEFTDLPREAQLDRISDLQVLVKTIKQLSDAVTA